MAKAKILKNNRTFPYGGLDSFNFGCEVYCLTEMHKQQLIGVSVFGSDIIENGGDEIAFCDECAYFFNADSIELVEE